MKNYYSLCILPILYHRIGIHSPNWKRVCITRSDTTDGKLFYFDRHIRQDAINTIWTAFRDIGFGQIALTIALPKSWTSLVWSADTIPAIASNVLLGSVTFLPKLFSPNFISPKFIMNSTDMQSVGKFSGVLRPKEEYIKLSPHPLPPQPKPQTQSLILWGLRLERHSPWGLSQESLSL